MKKSIYALFVACLFLFSCGGGAGTNSSEDGQAAAEEQVTEQESETADEAITSCEDFLDSFEEWANAYVDVIEAYMKDPTSIDTRKKYGELSQKAAQWPQEWTTHVICAQKEQYQKRYNEITDKLDKRLEELGFE